MLIIKAVIAFTVALLALPTAADAQTPRVEFLAPQLTRGQPVPFSEAVRVGDLLYLSGMMGTKPNTMELVPGGIEAEAKQALENIRIILKGAGAAVTDIVKCTVMLDDITKWSAFNRVYLEFFGAHRPVRSAFGVDGLALGGAVEIECIAVAKPASGPARM
jgi:reactive intermediate/imine deaminase